MKSILRFLKKIWVLNFLRRIFYATTFYNKKYWQILKWGFSSNEDTNFTYNLSEDNLRYLAQTISVVTGAPYTEVLGYVQEANQDENLKAHIVQATLNSRFKGIADTEVRFGRRLGWYAFARVIKPKIVVETGVDKGLGSVLLCAALLRNREEGHPGWYYGTDINPEAGYLLTGKYKETGEILYGDSIESLSKFTTTIDLFINDSDHSADYEYQEYQAIKNVISDSSILLGDNASWTNKLFHFSTENNRKFLFFSEKPVDHWYPGEGIGISFK